MNKAVIIATGWVGDTIICSAAAASLAEQGYEVTLFNRWPQLHDLLNMDNRFKTFTYHHLRFIKCLKPMLPLYFQKVVWEPKSWSYLEPLTSEMRRLAGCKPTPEYSITSTSVTKRKGPSISISRDLYKRAYGRNIDELLEMLSQIATLCWVGLDANKDSKKGRNTSLINDLNIMASTDVYLGPEGGLLWLAGGIGLKTVYFTEHFLQVQKDNSTGDLTHVLGTRNCFPDHPEKHIPLPYHCTNDEALKSIKYMLGPN